MTHLCDSCFINPKKLGKSLCAACEYEVIQAQMNIRNRHKAVRQARLNSVPRNRQKLCAVAEPVQKIQHRYEVSYISYNGTRLTETYPEGLNVWGRYYDLANRNLCGLRLSIRDGDKVRLVYSHDGSFRPKGFMKA